LTDSSASQFADKKIRQQKEALVRANHVRRVKKILKDKLRAGEIEPIALVAGLDPEWSAVLYELKIGPVLEAVPRLGPKTVDDILHAAGMNYMERLEYRTKPEVDVLVELLRATLLHH
jgi:hypothetical protein